MKPSLLATQHPVIEQESAQPREARYDQRLRTVIKREIGRSREARYDHRLHALLLCYRGFSCAEVSEMFGVTRRTVERWVRHFEVNGLDGLREECRPGRPSRISPEGWCSLLDDLSHSPRDFGFGVPRWTGSMVRRHLRLKYSVQLSIRQCQRICERIRQ